MESGSAHDAARWSWWADSSSISPRPSNLCSRSLRVLGNPEGYAVFRESAIRATLSTNPRALWAT
jgi:hypothetical protein